mmetsp:Transcript_8389/g.16676  ORF Transcript_8389/g.16676 Transcript_8389/m.16676 type:complete len:220 (-) Transcript_8389:6673-7332(-)
MAFLHLINCLLLTYVPIVVLYKCSSLHEHGTFVLIRAAIKFLVTAGAKIFILALLVPVSDEYNVVSDFMKEAISLIDIIGLYSAYTSSWAKGEKSARAFGIGVGWAAAESLFSNFFIFALNAGGGEFSWDYLQRGVAANCYLFESVAFAVFVYILIKGSVLLKPLCLAFLVVKAVVFPVALHLMLHMGMDPWTGLAFQGAFAIAYSLCAKLALDYTLSL